MNRPLLLGALLALAALPVACKSTQGHDLAADTASQVVEVGGAAGQTQLRLDNTLASLERIVATAAQNPKPAYDAFVSELKAFSGEFADLTQERGRLQTQAEGWFTEYTTKNDAIQDADMRKAGAMRLAEHREQVAEVSKQVDELMTGVAALQVRLTDLRTFLGNDLSAKAIESVSGKIADGVKDGRKLAAGLGKLSKSSTELASKLRAANQPAQQ